MSAVGANNSTDLTSGANKITTGTTFNESSSNWAFKLIANGTAKVETGYDAYHAVPGEATKVASSGDDTTASTENGSIQAAYAVSAATTLQAGTYTGGVTYTLTNEAKTGA